MTGKRPPAGLGPVSYRPSAEVASSREHAEATLMKITGVIGVGEGQDELGNPAWLVYLANKSVATALPARIEGRRVVYEVTGEVDAL
jgi:hypothetical protein